MQNAHDGHSRIYRSLVIPSGFHAEAGGFQQPFLRGFYGSLRYESSPPHTQFPFMTVLHIFYACGTINRKQAY